MTTYADLIRDMPDDSWVRPIDAREAYGIKLTTYKNWRESKNPPRRRGSNSRSVVHLGDFRRLAEGYRDRMGRRKSHLQSEVEQDRFVEMFEKRLKPGECARPGCDTPRDPADTLLYLCPDHQPPPAPTPPQYQLKCIQCQEQLARHSTGVRCRRCAVSHLRNARYRALNAA